MQNKNIGHSLDSLTAQFASRNIYPFVSKGFCETLKQAIHRHDEAYTDFTDLLPVADDLISAPDEDIAANEDFYEDVVSVHDDLIALMDRLLLFNSFLLKNRIYVSQAAPRIRNAVVQELNIAPEMYGDRDNIYGEVANIIEDAFDAIYQLREKFPDYEMLDRRQNGWNDDFSDRYLSGGELMKEDIYRRMEYVFFECFDMPLGLFEGCEDIHADQQNFIQTELYTAKIVRQLQNHELQNNFPGYTLIDAGEIEPRPRREDIFMQNSKNLYGPCIHNRPIFKPRNGLL